jgi:hypothetical protein
VLLVESLIKRRVQTFFPLSKNRLYQLYQLYQKNRKSGLYQLYQLYHLINNYYFVLERRRKKDYKKGNWNNWNKNHNTPKLAL